MPTTPSKRHAHGVAQSRCICRVLLIGLLWLLQQGSSLYAQSNCLCPTFGNTYTVTNNSPFTIDGSLRCAIECVNFTGNLNRIVFNIPTPGVNTITLTSQSGPLSEILKNGAIIDGTAIESVIIDGSQLTGGYDNGAHGLFLYGDNITVRGIRATGFTNSSGGGGSGIRILGDNALVENNTLTGNRIGIRIDETYNTIGSPPVSPGGEGGTEPPAFLPVQGVRLFNNRIGVTIGGAASGNATHGILVVQAPATLDVRGNIIANNGGAGIQFQVGGGQALISDNSIYCNDAGGIVRAGAPAAPVITQATTQVISGTAPPFTDIEVFTHSTIGCPGDPCQGRALIGVVSSNVSGNWFITPAPGAINAGNQVTATTTVSNLNTSPFSPCRTVVGCTISASINATQITCNGDNNGQLTAVPTGNVGATTYLWSTGATSATITGLGPGTYMVTITDSQECSATASATLSNPPPLSLSLTGTNLLCFGNNGGTVSSTVMGGVSPYTYVWSNGASTSSISGLPAGTYTLTLTDGNGCTRISSVTLSQPPQLSLSFNVTNETAFMANNGAIEAIVTGGTGSYSYSWGTGEATPSISGLAPGTYVLTVTDGNECSISDNATVAAFVCPPFSLDTSSTNITCHGFADGTISLVPVGGTPPLLYEWSNGATSADLGDLGPGTYSVTATDATNCTALASFFIAEPPPLDLSLAATEETAFMAADGTATALASGGTGTLQYLWDSGAVTPNITGLLPGTYSVTVTDENACTITGSVEVLPYICPPFSVSIAGTDLLCFEDGSGAAEAIVTGGSSPYTFLWADGVEDASRSGLTTGLYEVSVTDAFNCPASATVTINQPPLLVLTASATDEMAFQANDGTASTAVTGGTDGYAYAWSNGASSPNLSGLPPGTYSVTVTDENDCEATASVTVAPYICPEIFLFIETQNVACNGDMSGSATAFVSGGTEPYTYLWSTGSVESSTSGLGPGTYALTATDARNCPVIESINISQPLPLLISVFSDDETAFGANDGSAGATAGGGTGDLSFAWSNGNNGQDIFGLAPGTYEVTVTDENDCEATASVTVAPYICPEIFLFIETQNVACNGDMNGSATAFVSGGTEPYTYLWSTGSVESSTSGLGPGIYALTVTDARNCPVIESINISQPFPLLINVFSDDETAFGANDGSASATAGGGTGDLSYAWSNGNTGQDIFGLAPGTYEVTVTDENGCTAMGSVVIFPYVCDGFGVNIAVQDVACRGDDTGSLTATVTGAVGILSYAWSTGATSATLSGLPAGTYSLTVTDGANCAELRTATVAEPAQPLSVAAGSTDETAFGAADGTASASASGGTPGYNYFWSTGANSPTISELPPGTYTVTAVDVNECEATATVVVNPALCDGFDISVSSTPASCHGLSDGTATVSVPGTSYAILWSTGASAPSIGGLAAGSYSVTVTDLATGCIELGTATVSQPTAITASPTATNETAFMANDGTATANPSGGNTDEYTYAWSNGATTQTITNLAPGNYVLTVTDLTGCTGVDSVAVQPFVCPVLELATMGQDAACQGESTGMASVAVLDGSGQYTYLWSNGATTATASNLAAGTYTVTVTDLLNNCSDTASLAIGQPDLLLTNATATPQMAFMAADGTATAAPSGGTPGYLYAWSNGSADPAITGLLPGAYTVTVTDGNGCTAIANAVVAPYICSGFDVSLTGENVACHGDSTGSASATALGGDTSFTYAWSTGQATPDISNLPAGTYIVTVTDLADNCVQIDSILISQPAMFLANATATPETDVDANDGTATANPTGGTPDYSYDWGNLGTTQTITGLVPGLYFVTVTDANGCMAIDSAAVDSVICLGIGLEVQGQDARCHGEATGTATASSPNPEVSYLWSNGSTVPSLTGLPAGTYTVTATDAAGCAEEAAIEIGEPDPLLVMASATPETAFLAANGTAMASPTGGTPIYSYMWSEGSTGPAISGLVPGTYTVTVTDANGCMAIDSALVAAYICPGLALEVQGQDASCYGESTGTASAIATGGSGQYAYIWSSGALSQTATSLTAGSYTVTATDVTDNCPVVASVEIGEPDSLILDLTATAETAFMAADGTASVIPSGGTPQYEYLWSNGTTMTTISALLPGTYSVAVADANGCTAIGSIVVEPFICPGFELAVAAVDADCAGEATGQASVSVLNPTSTYQYAWSDGSTVPSIGQVTAGIYTVTVTDVANNCPDTASVSIGEPAPLAANATAMAETAFMAANGTASAMPTGGTPDYDYQWSNGATTSIITNLSPDSYTVTVTDANGCTAAATVEVSAFVCPGFELSIATQDVGCHGETTGLASASVVDGSSSYSFAWSNGATTAAITGLGPGVYTVTATDVANNCPQEASATISEPAPLSLTVTVSQETAFEAADGTATALVSGGTLAYSFLWSNGQTTATITALAPGTYGVTVTDMNDCTIEGLAVVTAFPCPNYTVAIDRSNVTCHGFEDGMATALPAGGTPNYTYLWSTGATTATINGLPPGTYSVLVRDADNCPAEQTTSISEPLPLTVAMTTSGETATGANNGTASAIVTGGVPPYSYAWSHGATGPNALGLAPGTYQLTVTDLNGCTALAEAAIDSVPPPPCALQPVFFLSVPAVVCLGDEFELEAEDLFPADVVRYIWYLPNGDSLISDRPFIAVLASTAEFSGVYAVRRDSLGCLSDTVRSAGQLLVLNPGAELADAGTNITLCSEVITKLDAAPPSAGSGTWQLLLGAATFEDAADPKTMVSGLASGRNLLRWRVSLAVCEAVFSDTLEVFVERPPLAVDDEHQLLRAQDVILMEVLLNDDLSGLQDTAVALIDMPARGSLSFDPLSGRFTYTEEEGFRGVVSFQYQVCNPGTVCSYPCDVAVVNIDVLNLPRVPEAIIIDGSERNRRLIIPGLDGFERIEVAIFNRWGDLVFQTKEYDNSRPWEGDLNGNGRYVPEGVYFYYLKAFENEVLIGEVLTGTIHVLEER